VIHVVLDPVTGIEGHPRIEAEVDGGKVNDAWSSSTMFGGTPVAKPDQPLEILRTVHSFDPGMACGVHVVDTRRRELVRVNVA